MQKLLKHILCLIFVAGVVNANVPFHDLVHKHIFIEGDHCGHSCKKHLKETVDPCCKMTDALRHVGLTPPLHHFDFLEQVFLACPTPYITESDFGLHFSINNKAPPLS